MAENTDIEVVIPIRVDTTLANRSLNELNADVKAARKELNGLVAGTDEYNAALGKLATAQNRMSTARAAERKALNQVTATIKANTVDINTSGNSIAALTERVNRLRDTWRNLDRDLDADTFARVGKELADARAELTAAEMSVGQFGRNVGNYASGFNQLNFQVQQVVRELPSLTVSLPQFFLALSNNLPMLADQISKARSELTRLNAEGQKGMPIWKQLGSSLLSWQTALVVGITIITRYGKEIVDWIGNLFKAQKQIDSNAEAMKAYNAVMDEGRANAQKDVTNLELLYAATQDVNRGMNERRTAVDELQRQYPDYLANMTDEEILAGNAAGAYDRLKAAIIAKAQAQAAADKIAENSLKILSNERQIQKNLYDIELLQSSIARINSSNGGALSNEWFADIFTSLGNVEWANAVTGVTNLENAILKTQKAVSGLMSENETLAQSNNVLINSIDVTALLTQTLATRTATVVSEATNEIEEDLQRLLDIQRQIYVDGVKLDFNQFEQRRIFEREDYAERLATLIEFGANTEEATRIHLANMAAINDEEATKRRETDEKERHDERNRLNSYFEAILSDANARNEALAEAERIIDEKRVANKEATVNLLGALTTLGSEMAGEGTAASKAFAIAGATIDMYAGAAAVWKDPSLPTLWSKIAGIATVMATGLTQIAQIRKVEIPKVRAGNGRSAGINSTPTAVPQPMAVLTSPIIETQASLNAADVDRLTQENRVYVVESDITEAQNRVKVVENESSY